MNRTRTGGRTRPWELDIADDLAGRVGLAIELAEAREQRQRAQLSEDRARIGQHLHDHVIQQLFGVGLELQALAGESTTDAAARLQGAIATIDDAIGQIRTIIFAIRTRPHGSGEFRRTSGPRARRSYRR